VRYLVAGYEAAARLVRRTREPPAVGRRGEVAASTTRKYGPYRRSRHWTGHFRLLR